MNPPTLTEIEEAANTLRAVAFHTPLVPLHTFDKDTDIYLKLEIHQPIGSFKIRGVFNAVASLDQSERKNGLSTVSAGNTAQALAWTGRYFSVPSRSLMPDTAPQTKIDAVKAYGGQPILVPIAEIFRFLKEQLWENEPYTFIHPWTNRRVMIGHATIGLEIMADLPEVDSVFVPVGGGALIGGIATAIKQRNPSARVYAVEPQGCAALAESFKQNRPASVDCKTICDGVAVPYMTDEVFGILKEIVDDVLLVSEDTVKQTVKRLALGNRIIAEPSAALPVAAALAMPQSKRGQSVCVVTGGSIDTEKLVGILTKN